MAVEGAVQSQDGFIAPDEAFFGDVAQQSTIAQNGVRLRLLTQRGGLSNLKKLDGRGLVYDGNKPIPKRAWLEANPAVGVELEILAPLGGGLTKATPLRQGGIELANVLSGGDDIHAIAHAEDGGNTLVDDGLRKRADRTDFVMDAVSRLGSCGGFVHGGLAGVKDEDGCASIVEKLSQRLAIDGTHLVFARVLEEEIAVLAGFLGTERDAR